ncbi:MULTISPECIES: GntR family transcriptional regulator [Clostridium]|uniref:GntR family transcriptional regulator n=2 Tax=Clostridium botulinum TaxID=1491 RepID=A0A6B4S9R0_CLOBO|nr:MULTISPECIES: GntR family transcriptional regulator [Clostridium]ACD52711.1 transcriptional regulator [Clostridium botulinum E3 str. Alaska E43]AJF31032.1 transcriptional regulator [Clostridium botulinum]AJF34094.1 transcriptional regulator [Clostridium botulinum]EES47755.1 transcriptional regulator [Clostridium botulinum E1 str. 'BoNT E Beluga']KIL08250.1 transcriptional regulator [Clostridium botulinum]
MDEKIPKYYLLKKMLAERIENEEFEINEPILSERELMEQYQMSRITVRKAIDELVNEGYLYKIQGKGTYIKTDDKSQDLFSITSCTEEVKALGMTPNKRVISTNIVNSASKHSKALNIMPKDKLFNIKRILLADNEPLNFTDSYLPYKLFAGIEKYNFEKESLYKILEEVYHVKITKARRTIEAILAKDEIAEYLDIDEGMPIILFGCTTYGIINGKEYPIETFKCYYRTDKFKFYIDQVK